MNLAPLWRPSATIGTYRPLETNLTVDVAIIGGGITGLTLAHRLKGSGRTVAVLEMAGMGTGATGHTSGHLTAALDVDYTEVVNTFGRAGAQEAAAKSREAIQHIETVVLGHRIDCEFQRVDGWRYTEDGAGVAALEAEGRVATDLGLDVEFAVGGPLPFMRGSLRFRGQASFHPVQYLDALARIVHGDGCHVFEHSRVIEVISGDPCIVKTEHFTVTATDVVHATHTPIGIVLPLQARIAPYTSYVIGLRLDRDIPTDLYWDTLDPYHYLRRALAPDGTPILLVGGEDHKTGQEPDTAARFRALEEYAHQRFPGGEVTWRWSGEVFVPVDGLPYIGRLGAERHVYGATGFAGNGLTFGTIAAVEIGEMILGQERPASVFRPQRYKPLASARHFLAENANAAWRMVHDRLPGPDGPGVEQIPAGEGRLCQDGGEKVAAYRAPDGRLTRLSPVCTHLGGIVQWNSAASTWDCPLHGARFRPTGEVLTGPACQSLQSLSRLEPGEEQSVASVVQAYEAKGYICELNVMPEARLRCSTCGCEGATAEADIEAFQRFEGQSDPDDMCVVVAVRVDRPDTRPCRGVLVLSFGPTASPEHKQAFASLHFDPRARSLSA